MMEFLQEDIEKIYLIQISINAGLDQQNIHNIEFQLQLIMEENLKFIKKNLFRIILIMIKSWEILESLKKLKMSIS